MRLPTVVRQFAFRWFTDTFCKSSYQVNYWRFSFFNCLMLIISLWRSRLQWNHAKPQKWQSLNYMGARLLLNCQECPLTELFCYSCLLRLRKNIRLASKLSFFCYLNIEIERKKEEKFDSLLTLALINLEFHTHSLKSCHGVSKLAGGSE